MTQEAVEVPRLPGHDGHGRLALLDLDLAGSGEHNPLVAPHDLLFAQRAWPEDGRVYLVLWLAETLVPLSAEPLHD